jgi:FkbM family methyltransferase
MIFKILVKPYMFLISNYIHIHNRILFLIIKVLVKLIKYKKVYIFNLLTRFFYLGNFCYSYYNVKLYNPKFTDPTFRYCNGGAYGDFYFNYLKKIKNKFQFIDIGANIGIYSLISSTNSSCLKIDSFEPIYEIYNNLRLNLSKIDFAHAHNFAVSDLEGQLKFYINPKSSGSSKIDQERFNIRIASVNSIFLKKLIFKDLKINIKIDVEGYEYLVLKEIINSFDLDKIQSIYVEIEDDQIKYKNIINLLKDFKLSYVEKLKKKSNCLFEKK